MLFLKGILIGMFICIPVGPIGLISVQRGILEGRFIGMLSGIGAAASDSIYCILAVFGVNFMDDLLKKHSKVINEMTGVLFIIIGLNILLKSNDKSIKKVKNINEKNKRISKFTSTFLMGISNPMTLIIFITIFANLNIMLEPSEVTKNIAFILSVFLGSCLLWLIVTSIIKIFKDKISLESLKIMDKVIGIAICLFGVFNILQ